MNKALPYCSTPKTDSSAASEPNAAAAMAESAAVRSRASADSGERWLSLASGLGRSICPGGRKFVSGPVHSKTISKATIPKAGEGKPADEAKAADKKGRKEKKDEGGW